MNIKLLKHCMVGNTVQKKNWIGTVNDDEGKALVAAGYAAEHKGPIPAAPDGKAAKGGNKSKADAEAKLGAILSGTVPEVVEALDGLSVDELDTLDKLETAGKDRAGVHDAITAAASAE